MKAVLIVAVAIWAFVIIPINSTTVSFDLEHATEKSYSTFLTTLRTEARDPKLEFYKVPMMPAPVTPPTYLLVELVATEEISVTLALARNDLYVWAYLDQYENKPRAHFFPDAPSNAKTTLFKEAKSRETIKYKSNYDAIENNAKSSRKNLGLGINKLMDYLEKMYGEKTDSSYPKKEATFLLVAIQMVSEAVRFKYIEGRVLANFPSGFNPDYKILSFENNWSKISKAFVNSKDGSIKPALILKDPNNKDWSVTEVSQIQPDMGLLSYNKGGKITVTNMFSQISRMFNAV